MVSDKIVTMADMVELVFPLAPAPSNVTSEVAEGVAPLLAPPDVPDQLPTVPQFEFAPAPIQKNAAIYIEIII
jgi:hypothetical protein